MSMFKKIDSFLVIYIFIIALLSAKGYARVYTKLELQQMAVDFVAQNAPQLEQGERKITASNIDARTPKRYCDSMPQVSTARDTYNYRQTTIKIKCLDEKNWQQFVHVRSTDMIPVIVASSAINKGERIESHHLTTALKAKHLSRGNHATNINALIGSRSKRTVRVGQPINKNQVCSVCKGDRVTIIAQTKGLRIKTTGEALQDGGIGDNIRIKNAKSGKKIKGNVVNVDTVAVSF